jgi:hypothetical protein
VVPIAGETITEAPFTVPTPLLIEMVGAGDPDAVHESIVACPDVIVEGEAAKPEMAGITLVATVTVTRAAVLPSAFVAVSV